jgi:hypothetical protein
VSEGLVASKAKRYSFFVRRLTLPEGEGSVWQNGTLARTNLQASLHASLILFIAFIALPEEKDNPEPG